MKKTIYITLLLSLLLLIGTMAFAPKVYKIKTHSEEVTDDFGTSDNENGGSPEEDMINWMKCRADLSGPERIPDGVINGIDRSIVVREWTSDDPNLKADLNMDREVGREDTYIIRSFWRDETTNCNLGEFSNQELTNGMQCRADLNDDGYINGIDRSIVVREWTSNSPDMNADLNMDGEVDGEDIYIIRAFWYTQKDGDPIVCN